MRAILTLLGTFIVGSLGWWLGEQVSLWLAVILGALGSGLGLYWARRWFDEHLG